MANDFPLPSTTSKCRESYFSSAEPRYYKDTSFNTSKNIAQLKSTNMIAHTAPPSEPHPRGEAKCGARMKTSSISMFPDAKDSDYNMSSKRSAAASNQFSTS